MVAALPLAARGAYFMLRMRTPRGELITLNEISRGTQYSHTVASVSAALSVQADTWIFQPCDGIAVPGGLNVIQSPIGVRCQPLGSGLSVNGEGVCPCMV